MDGVAADSIDILVVADEQPLDAGLAAAIGDVHESVAAEPVGSATAAAERGLASDVDGVVVGDGLDDPAAAIRRLAGATDVPVVVLTDATDRALVTAAIETSVADVHPPVATRAQCELLVERIAADGTGERPGGPDAPDASRDRGGRRGAYRTVFENVSDGLVVHDPGTGEILDVNERFCEMNGYDRGDLIGEDIGVVTAPGEEYSYETAREMIERAREEGSMLFEWRNRRKDGGTFPVEVNLSVVRLHGEERVLASVRDVTERKRREREHEQIFDGVNDSIVIQDPETAEPIDANRAFLDRLGYESVAEVREEGFEGLSATGAGYTTERARELCRQVIETGEPETVEWQQETKDGERRWIEATVDAAVIGGEERILSIQRDVTDRKRRERIIRTLHESTDDLQSADTPEAVCEAAVAAAREVLDLSMPACWLHGAAEEGTLTPVAATDEAWELPRGGGGPGEFEPGDFQYGIYERGESEVYDPGDLYDETPLGTAVLVPLGEHGLLGAGEPDLEAFDEVTLDAAHILARHTTAALDRVERERALRDSERRLRLIAEHIDEIIYLATADFSEILYINPAYEDIYGRPVAELEENPRAFIEAAHPEDRERYEADVAELVADVEAGDPADVYEGQYRLDRDGETRWTTVARFPVENDAGVVDRIVGRVRDVTERRELERTYRDIFGSVSDGLVVHDPETGEIVEANERACELYGADREDLVGASLARVTAPGEAYSVEQAAERIERACEEGPQLFEWRGRRGDGGTFPMEVSLSTVAIRGEERVLASVRDITERKRSERRFRTIAERVEEIIYLANADLTEVQYVNPAYADIFGRPVEELYEDARAFLDAVHPDDREDYEADVEAMLADIEAGDPDDRYEFAFRIERPDGEVRWLESTGYPIRSETDAPHQFVGLTKDVTERHRREQTLETFHEATRRLTAADSREAACRRAVRAAEDVLGFPLVSAYLYDEERGRLEPAAATDRLADLAVDPPPFAPGESLPWQVFVEGEAVTSSDPATDVYGPGVSDPDVVLPLGSHGVMLVGGPTDRFDAGDVELAQILAATLEAALNHVADERELAAREAELRRQQERADRLERLNAIIRDIERATVEESSRTGIEEAVCERLVAVEFCDLVWLAEPAVGDEELVARTAAGGKEPYLDALTVDVGAGAGGHPAVAAYRDETPRVVENVATDVAAGDWRTRALRHGIQSAVAVPIRHGTTVHGVLSVESAEPDAFDEATQDVLEDLGRSIGYAITVTEREQALESEGTTELEFAAADEGLFMVRAADAAGCRVSLERTIRRTGGAFSMFYVVEGAAPAAVAGLADAAPSVESAQVVSADEAEDRDGGLVEVTAPTWFGSVFTEHGAVVRRATAGAGGDDGTVVVETPRGTDVRTLVEGFKERYPETELAAQRQRDRTIRSLFELKDALRDELTERQWEALETAYSAGYFAWPREVSGQGIADLLGVSQPTFNKHLRIAERTAFRMLLDREYPDPDD